MNKKVIVIFVLIGIGMCFSVITLARYNSSSVWNYYLESHGFYFSSDNLSSEQRNVNTLWDGNSVYFNIKNSLNQNLITGYDIRYSVNCEILDETVLATCNLNGTNNSTITGVLSSNSACVNDIDDVDVSTFNKAECEIDGYSWEDLAVVENIYFDIVPDPNYDLDNLDVRITVSTTSPYNKTITGIFSLYKNSIVSGNISKQFNDYFDYDELVVTNSYEITKCVDVSFDSSKRIIDINDEFSSYSLDEDGYVEEFKLNISGMTSKKFVFFNKDFSYNYSIDDFIVSESNGC